MKPLVSASGERTLNVMFVVTPGSRMCAVLFPRYWSTSNRFLARAMPLLSSNESSIVGKGCGQGASLSRLSCSW